MLVWSSDVLYIREESNTEKETAMSHALVLPAVVDLTHYQAGAVVFECFDARFSLLYQQFEAWLKGAVDCTHLDRVVCAGGAKDLAADGTANQSALFDQIAKSVLLHQPPLVVVTTHEDCGAFGEAAQCGGDRAGQRAFHEAAHRDIERAILAYLPEFVGRIRHFYLSVEGVLELSLSDAVMPPHRRVDEQNMLVITAVG